MHELFLERGKEALGDGVVIAVASGAHRDSDAGVAGFLAEGQRDELAAWSEWWTRPRRSLDIATARALRNMVQGEGLDAAEGFKPTTEPERIAYAALVKQGLIEAVDKTYRVTEDVTYSLALE